MRRMEKITGRSDDMMIIRGVNVFPTQIEELVLKDKRLAPHYQLELYKQGNLDCLRANIEISPNSGTTIEESGDHIAGTLKKAVKDHVGISIDIVLHEPGGVVRSEGKAQRVVDKRG